MNNLCSPFRRALALGLVKTAPQAVVTGTSKRGTVVKDTYSLDGFADALDKAQAACGP